MAKVLIKTFLVYFIWAPLYKVHTFSSGRSILLGKRREPYSSLSGVDHLSKTVIAITCERGGDHKRRCQTQVPRSQSNFFRMSSAKMKLDSFWGLLLFFWPLSLHKCLNLVIFTHENHKILHVIKWNTRVLGYPGIQWFMGDGQEKKVHFFFLTVRQQTKR